MLKQNQNQPAPRAGCAALSPPAFSLLGYFFSDSALPRATRWLYYPW
jgi:hypothetical protein